MAAQANGLTTVETRRRPNEAGYGVLSVSSYRSLDER
jgi:hypothetical protein